MESKTLPGMPNIPNDWYWAPLSDLCKKVSVGHVGETSSVFCGPEGVTFLRSQNVRPGRLDLNDVKYVTKAFHEKSKKSQLKSGDILVVRVGQNRGDCAVVPDNVGEINCANIVFAQPKETRYSDYLGYFLNSSFGRASLLAVSTGSAQGVLNTKSVAKVLVPVPPIDLAKSIGYRLKLIDNKIELNQKTNQTLEQMAQALFKSWFVDFDPVFDNLLASVDFKLENLETSLPDELKQKAQRRLTALNSLENAAQYKASLSALAHELQALSQTKEATKETTQATVSAAETPVKANLNGNPKILVQHANTHAHFPNEFEHNEQLGWIPKGWTASNVGAEFDVVMGQSPPGSSYNEEKKGIPFFQGKTDYGFRFPTNRVYCTSPKRLARKNDTLVSVRAPVGTINLAAEDCAIGRGLAAVRHKSGSISFTYYAMNDLAKHFAVFEGEGTVFGSINQKDFNAITQLSYPLELILYFSSICSNWDNKIEQVSHQTIVLTKIRDTLLPKLISGELQIPDVATDEEVVD